MIRTMEQLVEDARTDTKLRRAMLETKQAADPMDAFCKRATELGYPVSIGELFAEGGSFTRICTRAATAVQRIRWTIGRTPMGW